MYDDEYFPNFLVDKIKAEIDKVETMLTAGETNTAVIQSHLDTMTRAINDLEDEFDANDSEIETVARDTIATDMEYIAQSYGFEDADIEELVAPRDW